MHYAVKNEFKDPEIRRRLTPTYELGCKRITQSSTFLPVTWKKDTSKSDTDVKEMWEKKKRLFECPNDFDLWLDSAEVLEIVRNPSEDGK